MPNNPALKSLASKTMRDRAYGIGGGLVVMLLSACVGYWWLGAGITGKQRATGTVQSARLGRVAGPSMAPRLYGPHLAATCTTCGFLSRWPLHPSNDSRLSLGDCCPNCGWAWPFEQDGQLLQRSQIEARPGDAWPAANRTGGSDVEFSADGPDRPAEAQRWELRVVPTATLLGNSAAAAQLPAWAIKRVVGLSGERITLSEGDIWVNGHRPVRSWEVLREMSVLVHDDRFRPAAAVGKWPTGIRWRPRQVQSRWEVTVAGYRWSDAATENRSADEGDRASDELPPAGGHAVGGRLVPEVCRSADELVFCPVQTWPQGEPVRPRGLHRLLTARGEVLQPISDDLPYNQLIARRINYVVDGRLTARVRLAEPRSAVCIHWRTGDEHWQVELRRFHSDDERLQVKVMCNQLPIHAGIISESKSAVFDGQLEWMVSDGRQSFFWNGELCWASHFGSPTTAVPGAWGWQGVQGEIELSELQVWRDIYFESPQSFGAPFTYTVPADGLFLIGDNVAASVDSR